MMKDAAKEISVPLTYIINLSLKSGLVPEDWKIAKVTPLHKGGTKEDYNNFRPISVLPILSKILERAVHQQLIAYLEENRFLSSFQFGYRKGRSTELATILLTDNIRKAVEEGNLVGVLFIDLSKAFDTLSHSIMLEKLKSFGILNNEHDWLNSYLFNRKQFCEVGNCKCELMNISCGVPQGSILGPLLFLLYFNDFERCLRHSNVINFADDTVVYIKGKEKQTIEKLLNEDIEYISNYFYKNQLIINLKKGKTESMIFGTNQRLKKILKRTRIILQLYKNQINRNIQISWYLSR